jgi:glycosyltransferase involved in cell wall biosynthesis
VASQPRAGAVGANLYYPDGTRQYAGMMQLYGMPGNTTADLPMVAVEPHVAGRGTPEDAAAFEARGIVAHLNLSEDTKADHLRSLDVFVSMSLWEDFNLPLAEAQALGTFSLAIDVGAHPELCPFLMNHPADGVRYIARAAADRAWLRDASALCATFIRRHYSWETTANEVKALLRLRR